MPLDCKMTLNDGTRKKLRNWIYTAGKEKFNILNIFGMTILSKKHTTLNLTCNMKEINSQIALTQLYINLLFFSIQFVVLCL